MRRLTIGLLGSALVVTACGGGSEPAASGETPPPVTETPARPADDFSEVPAESAPAADAPAAEAPADETPADEPATAPAPAEEAPAEEAPAEEAPESTVAPEPAPAPIGGRDLGDAIRSESAALANNPLPDLQVDDISRDKKVNLANVLPSARPVLVWAWAPH